MNNSVCTICQEVFINLENLYATKCGHIFHQMCINSWLEMGSKTCPQCRKQTLKTNITKLYFEVLNPIDQFEDVVSLRRQNECLQDELHKKETEMKVLEKEKTKACNNVKDLRKFVGSLEDKIINIEAKLLFYQEQSKVLAETKKELNEKIHQAEMFRKRANQLAGIKSLTEDRNNLKESDIVDISKELTKEDLVKIICLNRRDQKQLTERDSRLSNDLRFANKKIFSLQKQLSEEKTKTAVLKQITDNINRETAAFKIPKKSQNLDTTITFRPSKTVNEEETAEVNEPGPSEPKTVSQPGPSVPKTMSQPGPSVLKTGSAIPRKVTSCPTKFGVAIKKNPSIFKPARIISSNKLKTEAKKVVVPEYYNGLGGRNRFPIVPQSKLNLVSNKFQTRK